MNLQLENEFLRRAIADDGLESDHRLSPLEWRLFGAVDGLTSLAELARRWQIPPEAVAAAAEKLKEHNLLTLADYTLVEYRTAQAQVQTQAQAQAPAQVQVQPASEETPPASGDTGLRKFSASIRRRTSPLAGANLSSVRDTGAAVSSGANLSTGSGMNGGAHGAAERGSGFQLRPFIDFIINHAGGGTRGQLAVYRVFCQVPSDLLLKNRVTSLNLVGENFEIQDPILKTRLLDATRSVLGVEYR